MMKMNFSESKQPLTSVAGHVRSISLLVQTGNCLCTKRVDYVLLPTTPHSPSLPSLPPLSPLPPVPVPPLPPPSLLSPHRKREKQLEEEIKKASEEKEPLTRSRSSSKDDRRGSRKESASSEHMGMDDTPAAPSISPATPFHSIVRGLHVTSFSDIPCLFFRFVVVSQK